MKFALKKKKKKNLFLKPKQICINQKTSKGKKKLKRKEMNRSTCIAKKNRIEKFETQNLRRGTTALVLVEDTKVTN